MPKSKRRRESRAADVGPILHRGARWLVRSGIQNRSPRPALRGGVAAWYEPDKKIYPFLYSEITGYALSTFVFLRQAGIYPSSMPSACRAAAWCLKNALYKEGGVKTRFYLVKHYVTPNYCFHYGRVYAFDTAMVGYGLLQLYKSSKRAAYLQKVERILYFLTARMRKRDGTFYPYFDARQGKCAEDFEKWSDQEGAFHSKLALLFVDHYRCAADPRSKSVATSLLNAYQAKQLKDGRFITSQKDLSTHLHPHAYALEGLAYAGFHLRRPDYVASAVKGFEWMMKAVSSDGSVSSLYENGAFAHHERSDIVGQALRLGALLYALEPRKIKPYLGTLEAVKKHLMQFQFHEEGEQDGGFLYGSSTDGLMRNHLNAWSTMFALQALWMHRQFITQKKDLILESFV